MGITRRQFVKRSSIAAGAVGLTAAAAIGAKAPAKKYRVGLIGHTGRGGYGHGLDRAWRDVPQGQIVGLADANPRALASAVKRTGAPKGYADYRKMLDECKIDILTIGPTYIDKHCEMVLAAAERGVRGIYIEKPLCRTLEEADKMVAACERNYVKCVVAHLTWFCPILVQAPQLLVGGPVLRILFFCFM